LVGIDRFQQAAYVWTVGKKMGMAVLSAKGEDGERTYSVKS
jgi:hypothetical protein